MSKTIKKRKVDSECRIFQKLWELEYFFMEHYNKPVCVICQESVAINKVENIKRHYESKHKSTFQKIDGNLRLDEFNKLKNDKNNTNASYVISKLIAQRRKPVSDGEFSKDCIMFMTDDDDPDEGIKELIDCVFRLFKCEKENKITEDDFVKAVKRDNLLLECLGKCLPSVENKFEIKNKRQLGFLTLKDIISEIEICDTTSIWKICCKNMEFKAFKMQNKDKSNPSYYISPIRATYSHDSLYKFTSYSKPSSNLKKHLYFVKYGIDDIDEKISRKILKYNKRKIRHVEKSGISDISEFGANSISLKLLKLLKCANFDRKVNFINFEMTNDILMALGNDFTQLQLKIQYICDIDVFENEWIRKPSIPSKFNADCRVPLDRLILKIYELIEPPQPVDWIIDTCAIQLYKKSEFGAYLDMSQSIEDQKNILDVMFNDDKYHFIIRTKLCIRVFSCIEKLLNDEGTVLKNHLFGLKYIFESDEDFVHEFVNHDGLQALMGIFDRNIDKFFQNYVLKAMLSIMVYVDGMEGFINQQNVIIWTYEQLSSKHSIVLKNLLCLLLTFVKYIGTNTHYMIDAMKLADLKINAPLTMRFMIILKEKVVVTNEIITLTLKVINELLENIDDQTIFYEITDAMKKQEMTKILKKLNKYKDNSLKLQLETYSSLLQNDQENVENTLPVKDSKSNEIPKSAKPEKNFVKELKSEVLTKKNKSVHKMRLPISTLKISDVALDIKNVEKPLLNPITEKNEPDNKPRVTNLNNSNSFTIDASQSESIWTSISKNLENTVRLNINDYCFSLLTKKDDMDMISFNFNMKPSEKQKQTTNGSKPPPISGPPVISQPPPISGPPKISGPPSISLPPKISTPVSKPNNKQNFNDSEDKQKRLIKLHWNNGHEKYFNCSGSECDTIWTDVRVLDSIKVDFLEIERLFESKQIEKKKNNKKSIKTKTTLFIDRQRSTNLTVALRKFPEQHIIKNAILKMDITILSRDMVEKLSGEMLPKESEINRIKELLTENPDLKIYDPCEKFLVSMNSISQVEERLSLWLFKLDFPSIEEEIGGYLHDLMNGLENLKKSQIFKNILFTILKLGKFMNNSSKNAFQIDYLKNIGEIKETGPNKNSLMHHIAKIMNNNFETSANLYSEMGAIIRCSKVDSREIKERLKKLETACKNCWKNYFIINKKGISFDNKLDIKNFLMNSTKSIQILQISHRRLMNRYYSVLAYFGFSNETAKKLSVDEFCIIIRDFSMDYNMNRDQVLEKIQKKKERIYRRNTRGKTILNNTKIIQMNEIETITEEPQERTKTENKLKKKDADDYLTKMLTEVSLNEPRLNRRRCRRNPKKENRRTIVPDTKPIC
ncbi:hypothetical protein A3Q56_02681 [Intoshia linei]|uniref:SPIN-DOC-like zinc-finger domain-containing protein n=1 Tax=Intoshia linei TaxID=1819745 RepID=A0A177B7B6_9BILA|nr:hypothetical protein A3Q56_02681 [Intoshia linei]